MLKYLFITAVICFIINMPIGYSLGVASMAFVVFNGLPVAQWVLVPQRIAMSINSFPLLAIPYFMVAGAVMELGGVSKRIINLASAIVGHIKGGVASASIISCAIFAAISGSTPPRRRPSAPLPSPRWSSGNTPPTTPRLWWPPLRAWALSSRPASPWSSSPPPAMCRWARR